jgi:hypothetical protein
VTEIVGPFVFGQVSFRQSDTGTGTVEVLYYDKGGLEWGLLPDGSFGPLRNDPGWVSLEAFRKRKIGRSRYWNKTEGSRYRANKDRARLLTSHSGMWGCGLGHPHDSMC